MTKMDKNEQFYIDKLNEIRKILFEEFYFNEFGGPGSGRHPEGGSQENIVHPDSPEVQAYIQKAKEAGNEIENIGLNIVSNLSGQVTEIDYKSANSIARKANDYYKGKVDKVKDAVRNTVIVDKQNIQEALDKAKSIPGYIRTNERNPDTDDLGYKGNAIIFKTKNGMFGEVQINTPEIIYAKETESIGRKMLGDKKYDEIAKRIGVKGGLGHKLYEEWRVLKEKSSTKRKSQIETESKNYYKHFFITNYMKNNYNYIRQEILNDKVVYFEWVFEEIAFKYVNDDNIEAKNKGYGGPFPILYDTKLLAEAFLSNPRIITKEEYENY
jgi:hypothetical protein